MPFITQTDSMTNLTMGAGFFMLLTTVMSLGLRVLRLLMALCRAGMASARSFSQSSRIAWAGMFTMDQTVTYLGRRSCLVGQGLVTGYDLFLGFNLEDDRESKVMVTMLTCMVSCSILIISFSVSSLVSSS